jgi:glycine oxidase
VRKRHHNVRDVIVVGAGIAGTTLAHHLARAGVDVALFDRQMPGREASGGLGGLLTTVSEAMGPYADLSRAALAATLAIIPELQDRSSIDIELRRTPVLRVATDASSIAMMKEYERQPADVPREDTRVEGEALRALFPELAPNISTAILSPTVHHLNPRRLIEATISAARTRHAAVELDHEVVGFLRHGRRVTGVVTNAGEDWLADQVVLANGAWAASLLGSVGLELDLRPVRGQLVVLDATDRLNLPFIVTAGRGYVVPKTRGRIVVGATHEEAGFEKHATLGGMVHLSKVASVVPRLLGLRVAETFVGLRPTSPDGMPLLGEVPCVPGLSLALGYGQHGVLLANVCAALLTEAIYGRDPGPLWPFFQATRAVREAAA